LKRFTADGRRDLVDRSRRPRRVPLRMRRHWIQRIAGAPAASAFQFRFAVHAVSRRWLFILLGIVTMKARSNHCCPVCGHPVGASRWFWRAWIWARWHCASCGSLLRFDFRRRLMLGLYVGLFYALVMGIAVLLVLSRISPWIWAVPILGIYIWGTVIIFARGDKIVVADKG